jgi:hypothetical protein
LAFVENGGRAARGRAGLIFRVVNDGERSAINFQVQRLLNDVTVTCGNLLGFRHLLDVDHLAHIWKRHSQTGVGLDPGHLPLSLSDLLRLPAIVQPRNITKYTVAKGMARLVFEKHYEDGHVVAVEELRPTRRELIVKTLYKQK